MLKHVYDDYMDLSWMRWPWGRSWTLGS